MNFSFDSWRQEKNPRLKAQLRREIEDATKRFLEAGGQVTECKPTCSGRLQHYDEELVHFRWGKGYVKKCSTT